MKNFIYSEESEGLMSFWYQDPSAQSMVEYMLIMLNRNCPDYYFDLFALRSAACLGKIISAFPP
jgi:hypothetical protein